MSTCIDFCGGSKKKNKKPDGKFEELKPQLPQVSSNKDDQFKKQDVINRLRYVQIDIQDQGIKPPPPGIDIKIDF